MALGLVELVILVVLGGVVFSVLFRGRAGRSGGSRFSWGHASLNCPHCGAETRAGQPQCEHCGRDL